MICRKLRLFKSSLGRSCGLCRASAVLNRFCKKKMLVDDLHFWALQRATLRSLAPCGVYLESRDQSERINSVLVHRPPKVDFVSSIISTTAPLILGFSHRNTPPHKPAIANPWILRFTQETRPRQTKISRTLSLIHLASWQDSPLPSQSTPS